MNIFISVIKNLARVCFPEHFEKKRIRLVNAIVGKGAAIYKQALISNSNSRDAINIGEGTHVAGMLVRIYSVIGITIGNNVQIAHNVTIFDSNIHSVNPAERQKEFIVNTTQGFKQIHDLHEKEVIISDNVWIGAGSFILKGVTIGENTIIGAGSVVVKDLPPNVIAVGNPAKIKKTIVVSGS
jgi:acetyltransferase-like isoleucine patch superfamily enzyme